ncbi:MAG: Gfo/Idh/MocA family oxidoreductase [Bacteroidales bacterium]|nr:Gfo/Idh/MocA family oxidoreductase [Bacteroidales bacterium]
MQRRTFLKNAAAISAVTMVSPSVAFGSRANSAVRLGIIGCGGRGTAVLSSMAEHTDINIIAMADLFEDQLQKKKGTFDQLNSDNGFPKISRSNMYQGSEAWKKLLDNQEVDAVLISTPAYVHADYMEAAVHAGKHVYCEKPVAPDVAGCKQVERVGARLNGKVSIAVGFQIRQATPYVEMVKRIQRGDIGKVINVQLYYLSSAPAVESSDKMSYDEKRIRNHFHFRALSGGIVLDQAIHQLDVCNWAINSRPIQAVGQGGRRGRPDFGDSWSNYQVLYQYPGNINVSLHSTQIGSTFGDVCARFIGTKGMAEAHYSRGVYITGENEWDSGILKAGESPSQEDVSSGAFSSSLHDANENKVKSFINSIRTGSYLNQAREGARSTLSAIMGREAGISESKVTWDEIYLSNSKLDPQLNLSQFD